MKRAAIAALACALLFGILATWLGPKGIEWYATPGVNTPLNCNEPVAWALHKLVVTQLWSLVIGAVVGLVIGILLARRNKPAPAAPAPGSPP